MGGAIVALFASLAALVLYLRYRMRQSRPSDYAAIDSLLAARGLRQIAVTRDDDYWRYWLRGHLTLSNCARIYVAVGEAPGGHWRELHVAFDPWLTGTAEAEVLLEREADVGPLAGQAGLDPAGGSPTAVAEFLRQREVLERAKRE